MSLKYLAVKQLGLSEAYVQRFLDYEIMFDFVMTNLDRHMNNISFVRDSNTLQVVGFASIYDNGNSMFWNFAEIPQGTDILRLRTCTFNNMEVRNLRYVRDRSLLQLNKLPTADEVRLHYQQDATMPKDFLEEIIRGYNLKVAYLQEFQKGVAVWDIPRKKGYFNV